MPGFGTEINHRILRRFAVARTEEEIAPLLEQFFGLDRPPPRRMAGQIAADRAASPERTAVLSVVAEAILDGTRQRTVDRQALADLDAPVKVIWGTADRILPVAQASGLPGLVATHLFEGIGHMPHLEVHRAVSRLLAEQIQVE